ncbi:Calcium/calmodulin dependent protein kinase II association domain protein [compost metagenome]
MRVVLAVEPWRKTSSNPSLFLSLRRPTMKNSIIVPAALALFLAGCTSYSSTSGSATGRTEACKATSEQEISALFDRWNRSLQTGDPHKVVANYAERSVLLATVSNKPRLTPSEKEDYFHHFLENKPVGTIDWRMIEIDCNSAVDAGLYTFTFGTTGAQVKARYTYTYKWDGQQWLITSHHSSAMPEKK